MASEDQFPTIRDYRDVLADLVEKGFGELPAQILMVPDSTLQALARYAGQRSGAKPAQMIGWRVDEARLEVSFASVDGLRDSQLPTTVS